MLNESLNDSFETIPSYTMNEQVVPPSIQNVYDDDVMFEDEEVDDDDSFGSSSPGVLIVPPGQTKAETLLETEDVGTLPATTNDVKISLPDSLPSDVGSVQEISEGQDLDDDILCQVAPEQQPALEPNLTLETVFSNPTVPSRPTPASTPTSTFTAAAAADASPPEEEDDDHLHTPSSPADTPIAHVDEPPKTDHPQTSSSVPSSPDSSDCKENTQLSVGCPVKHDIRQKLSFVSFLFEPRKEILFTLLAWFVSIVPLLYVYSGISNLQSRTLTLQLEEEIGRLKQAQMMVPVPNEDLVRMESVGSSAVATAKEEVEEEEDGEPSVVFSDEQVRRIRQEAQEQALAIQEERQTLFELEIRRIRKEAQEEIEKIKREKEMLLEAEILRLRDEAARQSEAVQAEKEKVLKEQMDVLKDEARKYARASEEESKRRLQDEIRRIHRKVRPAQEQRPLPEDPKLADWLKSAWESVEESNLADNCWINAKANVGLGECGIDAAEKAKKELMRWGKSLWRAQENLFERWEDLGKKVQDFTTEVFKRNLSETGGDAPPTESKEGSTTGKRIGLVAATVLASGVAYASLTNILSESENFSDLFDLYPNEDEFP